MKKKISLPLLIIALFLFSVLVALVASQFLFKASTKNPAYPSVATQLPGGDFTLQSNHGDISLHDFKGRLVLLYFGYTYCPDICPTSLALMGQAINKLTPAEKEQVQGLFVSVDPERDTLKHLEEYSQYFGANIIGITGKKEEIDNITKRYGVGYRIQKKDKNGNYTVDHSAVTLLIGKDGKIKELLPHGMPADELVKKLRDYM